MKNVIINEKQLNLLVSKLKEDTNETHIGGGSKMAKEQLFTIATLATKMWENLPDDVELEDWQESKIAQCEQSIISVVKSYMYKDVTDDVKAGNKLNFDDLIIGN
jgi:hypothetical protein